MNTAVATPPALDLDCLFQPVRIRKTGTTGSITQAYEIRGMKYIEVTTDDGAVHWPLCAHDIEALP